MICPQNNDTPPDSLVPHYDTEVGSLGPEAASCACTFSCLSVAVRKCGKPKKKKLKLNFKEALPSKEANSVFNISSVQRFAAPRKHTMSSRDMAVGISSSAEFMQPLVLTIIIATQCIVLAVKDCAVLSICHTGCDPPLPAHYSQVIFRGAQVKSSFEAEHFIKEASVAFYIWRAALQLRRVSRSASSGLEFARAFTFIWIPTFSILHCHALSMWR